MSINGEMVYIMENYEAIKKQWDNIYTMKYQSAMKKNEIMSFATTWMDLEGIMLSKISQMEKDTICFHLYVESEK